MLLIFVRFVLGPFALRTRFRQLRLCEHPVRLTADALALKLEGGSSDSRMAWATLSRIDRNEDHYFFWINDLHAIIVPLRAIGSEIERRRLWDMASRGTGAAAKS